MVQDKLHRITIRLYGLYSKTGNIDSLKKYGINNKNIDELNELVGQGLGGGIDSKIDTDKDKLLSKSSILELQILHFALSKIMRYELERDIIADVIDKKQDHKSKYYIDKVYELTQIKIKTIEDVEKINKEIERRTDKYLENFKEEESKETGVTFMQVVFSVFKLSGFEKVDYDMVLSDFFELKNIIPKKADNGRPE